MFIIADSAALKRFAALAAVLLVVYGLELYQQNRARTPQIVLQPTTAPTAPPMLTFVPPTLVPTLAARSNLAPYPNYGPAAELRNQVWFNTDAPLRLADLRGRVVLLEFWSFDCPGCRLVVPYLRDWHARYADAGLTVIGVHSPEAVTSQQDADLAAALAQLDIPYPVTDDHDGASWRAYGQRIRPTIYLIDKRGNIRYQRIGAGAYTETEAAIAALLAESV